MFLFEKIEGKFYKTKKKQLEYIINNIDFILNSFCQHSSKLPMYFGWNLWKDSKKDLQSILEREEPRLKILKIENYEDGFKIAGSIEGEYHEFYKNF